VLHICSFGTSKHTYAIREGQNGQRWGATEQLLNIYPYLEKESEIFFSTFVEKNTVAASSSVKFNLKKWLIFSDGAITVFRFQLA